MRLILLLHAAIILFSLIKGGVVDTLGICLVVYGPYIAVYVLASYAYYTTEY